VVGRQNADTADTLHLRDVATATTFWLSMGVILGVVFWGQAIPRIGLHSRYRGFKGRCHGNHFFGFLYMKCTLVPPGKEPSMCGGDAALCQITLTTCCTAHRRVSLYFRMGYPFPFNIGELDPHLIHGSFGPLLVIQTASRSVQPFLHSSLQNVPILYHGPPLPLKIVLSHGGSGPPCPI